SELPRIRSRCPSKQPAMPAPSTPAQDRQGCLESARDARLRARRREGRKGAASKQPACTSPVPPRAGEGGRRDGCWVLLLAPTRAPPWPGNRTPSGTSGTGRCLPGGVFHESALGGADPFLHGVWAEWPARVGSSRAG